MHLRRQTPIAAHCSGFTLVEVTLALLITGLVLSMVYGSVKGVSGSVESISLRNELYRTNYALLEEMGRELSSAFLSRNSLVNPGNALTYFHVEDLEESGMPKDNLYFTTYGHAFSPNPQGEADQSEVCYQPQYNRARDELMLLKKEDLTTNELTCRDEDSFDLDRPAGEQPYVVATGIHPEKGPGYRFVGFDVQLFDPNQEDNKEITEWDTQDDIEHRNRMPRQVKVTLTYEGPQKDTITFYRTIWLQLGSIVQQPGAGMVLPAQPGEQGELQNAPKGPTDGLQKTKKDGGNKTPPVDQSQKPPKDLFNF